MATSNNNYELTSTLAPTTAGAQYGTNQSEWGIQSSFGDSIIQSEDITSELVTDQTQDQMGRVVSELDYDKHWTCTLQVIGAADLTGTYKVGSIISYEPLNYGDMTALPSDNKNWKIRSISTNGSYNDKKKYTFTLEKWSNFPSKSV